MMRVKYLDASQDPKNQPFEDWREMADATLSDRFGSDCADIEAKFAADDVDIRFDFYSAYVAGCSPLPRAHDRDVVDIVEEAHEHLNDQRSQFPECESETVIWNILDRCTNEDCADCYCDDAECNTCYGSQY